MSEVPDLQFERAEYETAPSAAQCAECQRQLIGHYYDVNGQTVCEACRYSIESRRTEGSSAGRFLRASGAGLVAAVGGAILYYAITAVSGYELGLIAIAVGYAVGAAVRWGSNGRGGWRYQTLAMLLTYLAIVSTYVPPMIEGFREARSTAEIDQEAIQAGATPPSSPAPLADSTPATQSTSATGEASATDAPPPTAIVILVLVGIVMAAPFLAGFENVIGIVIIGIGLYEAWKLNRRQVVTITGPHALSRPPAEPASA